MQTSTQAIWTWQSYPPAFSAPRIRGPFAGVRCRSTHHSIAAGASQPEHDISLSAYRHQQGVRHGQSAESLARHDSHGARPDARLTGWSCLAKGSRWRTRSAPSGRPFVSSTVRPHRRAMIAIENCRTAALGGHVERCGDCGYQRIAYDSCRNRNCPKCQGLACAQWIADRQAELLDVPYFHVVFTVPAEIG